MTVKLVAKYDMDDILAGDYVFLKNVLQCHIDYEYIYIEKASMKAYYAVKCYDVVSIEDLRD